MPGTYRTRHSWMPKRRAALLTCVAACCSLGLAAAAWSDTEPAPAGLATLAPNNAGAASHLKIDAEGSGGGLEPGKLPVSLEFAVQNGFTVDPKAVSGVCSNSQADNGKCPSNSQFAAGTIDLIAHGPGFGSSGQRYTADLALYVGEPQQPGDPAGAVFYFIEPTSGYNGSSRGRIATLSDPTYGTEVRFEKLPLPPLPPGVSFDLQNLKLDIGTAGGQPQAPPAPPGPPASSAPSAGTPTKKHKKRRKHHRKSQARLHTRRHAPRHAGPAARAAASSSFLVNPATCSGSWSVRLQIGYSDGVQERDASAPCTS